MAKDETMVERVDRVCARDLARLELERYWAMRDRVRVDTDADTIRAHGMGVRL